MAYCSSLIEHVEPSDRERVAAEIRRVARRFFVQTPNRWFPIEPHVLLPLFQFLPRAVRRRLWRFGAGGGEFEDIALLDRRELARLFPDAQILRERVGPLTKSLIAVGPRGRMIGQAAEGAGLREVRYADAGDAVDVQPARGDLVLVKASHGMRLDRLVERLVEAAP